MNYTNWNKIICEYYFHQEEGVMTFLSISKDELIDIGLACPQIQDEIKKIEEHKMAKINARDFVWKDFLRLFSSLKINSKQSFFRAFAARISESVSISETDLPTIFPFLVLFFIPLSEDSELSASAFYPKISKFLRDNGIIGAKETVNTPDLSRLDPPLDFMWNNLCEWAALNNYTFSLKYNHSSTHNQYVDQFIAELLFTSNRKEALKKVFVKSGLTQDESLSNSRILNILSDKYYFLGIRKTVWNNWLLNYNVALVSEFRKIYNSWDGSARILEKEENTSSRTYEYEGANYKLILGFTKARDEYEFHLTPFISACDTSEDFSFVDPNNNAEYEFYILSSGFANESLYCVDKIKQSLSIGKPLVLNDSYDSKVKLIFNPEDFYLFEKHFDVFTAKSQFVLGGHYYALINNKSLPEYSEWLSNNNAEQITTYLDANYSFYHIPTAIAPLESVSKLTAKKQKKITPINTFIIGKSDNVCSVPKNFPIYFEITGVDIHNDDICAVSVHSNKISKYKLTYDEDRQCWTFAVIKNAFDIDKAYRIFCNDEPISSSLYKFVKFDLLGDSQYNELSFNEWGELTETAPAVTGLTISGISSPGINIDMLSYNMKQFGSVHAMTGVKYAVSDFVLYAMSSYPRITKEQLKSIIETMIANGLVDEKKGATIKLQYLIEYYFYMGYINCAYKDSKYIMAVNKPTLIWLPPKFTVSVGKVTLYNSSERSFKFLVTGARTPSFVSKLEKICNSNRVKVEYYDSSNPLYPQKIILWCDNLQDIQKVVEQANLCFQRCIYSNSLLSKLGNIESYEQHITANKSDDSYKGVSLFRCIDYSKLAKEFKAKGGYITNSSIQKESVSCSSDVVTYFCGTPNEETIYWKDDVQYKVNKYWGHFLGAWKDKAKIVYYDNETTSFIMPSQIILPPLLARALTMINAEFLDSSNGRRSFHINCNPFAGKMNPDEILDKLLQR